ncbi:MAG TPA: imidazole glycerol phosphate synthase cyclase subunit [Gammaproteobacteria bacterium]|nr:imidazole glycerol phosphate synthase cyclase subunit [Gammaproteobacteria bacterium]
MKKRIIARLDIKGQHVIKGIQFEGLRKLGDPEEFAINYYNQGASEILYLDSVASLYDRSYLISLIKKTARNVFIPITVGGGIKSLKDVYDLLRSGADKVAINTAAIKNPKLLRDICKTFGVQCLVLQLDVKNTKLGYEVFVESGREPTGIRAIDWVQEAQSLGCGEILLTSIDRDGTRKGFDMTLLKEVAPYCRAPLIVSGGIWSREHFNTIYANQGINAIALGSTLHYKNLSLTNLYKEQINYV